MPPEGFGAMNVCADMRHIIQGYVNLREALDPSIDIIVHCHNEFDPMFSVPAVESGSGPPCVRGLGQSR
jgi:hypothetical protein